MIRRLNNLAASGKPGKPFPSAKQFANKGKRPKWVKIDRPKESDGSNPQPAASGPQADLQSANGFRVFLQPYEATAMLYQGGSLIQGLKRKHLLYKLNMGNFVDINAARSLKIQTVNSTSYLKRCQDPEFQEEHADKLADAIIGISRELLEHRLPRDRSGMVLKPGTGQLRLAVRHSVAAKFADLVPHLFGGKWPRGNESISVNKELIPETRDQLFVINFKKPEDLRAVREFVRQLTLLEMNMPVKPSTEYPRAHILPRSEINYFAETAMAKRGHFHKIRLVIPEHMTGTIIGKGAENIKQLRKDSGAFIRLIHTDDAPPVLQIVSKEKEELDKALAAIKELLEYEWYSEKSKEEIERVFLRAGYNL